VARINLLGNYMSSVFAEMSDGHGGTIITEATYAYDTGTAPRPQTLAVPHH
jgi:hypothetical protein